MAQKYNHQKIEKKWQDYWLKKKTFFAKDFSKRKKKYVLVEFPYPSGEGLHMGHLRPYVAGDVYSRFLRLQGKEVMYPIGWDAFGLPAENYAIKHKVQPEVSTARNIKNAKRQLQSWGLSFDWSREVNTTDPNYYKWTQWIFLQFYKAGLAYEATGLINWCPKDKTGLANEEVIDGKCERCGATVEKKELRQWYLRITAYAEKLLQGLKDLPQWPEAVKLQQENWIGKSTGAEVEFQVKGAGEKIKIFTTRPDTIFGATYMVLAPEHPIVEKLKTQISNFKEVEKYIVQAKGKSDLDRSALEKEKTGVELKGIKAINPATGEEVPVWIADYVLSGYGTGAIMAVPAHDERDFEFARKFGLPIKPVVNPRVATVGMSMEENAELRRKYENGDLPYLDSGTLINSPGFNNLTSEEALPKMAEKFGKLTTQYKLRDWVFSRQRYWGEPIPIIHCEKCGIVPVPEKDLPVKLPKVKNYEPTGTGESPLAAISTWVNTKCPKCKGKAKRETNTMPQWAGSSWYYLRYTDPRNKKEFASKKNQKYWTPVDVYFGGMEHTTLHLLYSRFWNLFLYDRKLVTSKEPYQLRKPHGIILAADGEKMSKSRGNVVNPDDIVKLHGADTLRMYELFLGPHEMTVSWNDQGVVGVRRFLDRVWIWAQEKIQKTESKTQKEDHEVQKALHKLIKKVTEDLEGFRFNTAVSAFMEFHNQVKDKQVSLEIGKKFITLLYPFAPHISEEINQFWGSKKTVQLENWPKFNPDLVVENTVEMVIQVNGKLKGRVGIKVGATETEVRQEAEKLESVRQALSGLTVKRVVFVPNKLINYVV